MENKIDVEALCELIKANRSLKELVGKYEAKDEEMSEILSALKQNCSITKFIHLVCQKSFGTVREIMQEIMKNREIGENMGAKVAMLALQRRRDGNLVNQVPTRLLIHLLSFLDKYNIGTQKAGWRGKAQSEIKT